MNNFELVVAHFNESLDWLRDVTIVATVYHKGGDSTFARQLPNTGREAHTYLTHIYENYDNLADYTIFCQGRSQDHCPDIISILQKTIQHGKPDDTNVFNDNIFLLCQTPSLLYNDRDGLPHMYPPIDVGAESDRLFDSVLESFPFTPGAQFIVPKENILSRSKEFYKQCLLANWEYNPMNLGISFGGPMACVYERLWLTIFNKQIPAKY
jgi:hypothetical protein